MNKTGQNITENLELCGMTLKEIAKRGGIKYDSLRAMKKRGLYTSDIIDKLSDATGLTPEELVGNEASRDSLFRKKLKGLAPNWLLDLIGEIKKAT
jgi:transcriptional regulator with XRE-family HTH domain